MKLSELYLEAARVAKMIECTELMMPEVVKINGHIHHDKLYEIKFTSLSTCIYEFPLALVEGKPVFTGDILYTIDGMKFIADHLFGNALVLRAFITNHQIQTFDAGESLSWNPPKPKTFSLNGKEYPLPDSYKHRGTTSIGLWSESFSNENTHTYNGRKEFFWKNWHDADAVMKAITDLLEGK